MLRTDLGDLCAACGLAVVLIAAGLAWAGPRWYGKRRDFKQWEQQMNSDETEEPTP